MHVLIFASVSRKHEISLGYCEQKDLGLFWNLFPVLTDVKSFLFNSYLFINFIQNPVHSTYIQPQPGRWLKAMRKTDISESTTNFLRSFNF